MASFAKKVLKSLELAIRRATLRLLKRGGAAGKLIMLPELGSAPTILLLRQDRLGDAIITTPLLYELHKKYPEAKILMLLGGNNKSISPMLPDFVEPVLYEKSLIAATKLAKALRQRKIDVIVDMTDNASVTSSILVSMIKPKYSVGIEKENSSVYDVVIPRLDRSKYHISERIAELLRPFGIDPAAIDRRPRLVIKRQAIEPDVVGINISAGSESRIAKPEAWAEVIRRIHTAYPRKSIRIHCEPKDSLTAKHILDICSIGSVSLANSTKSFEEFASELSRCAELITPDTSVVHLGAAMNIPMTVIFAPIPEGLCYWTPTGVTHTMLVAKPSLKSMDPDKVLAAYHRLQNELTSTNAHASLDL